MIKFFLIAFFATFIGFVIISSYEVELADNLVVFVGAILIATLLFKIVLDIFVHHREEEIDGLSAREMQREAHTKTYYSLEEFNEAEERRTKKQMQQIEKPNQSD